MTGERRTLETLVEFEGLEDESYAYMQLVETGWYTHEIIADDKGKKWRVMRKEVIQ